MRLRPLIIDDWLKGRAAQIVKYASEHHYIPYVSPDTPGGDPNCIVETAFGYRCVFSFTEMKGELFRDLSVSVPAKGKYPNDWAVFVIAKDLFGFTGVPTKDWMINKDVDCDAVRVVQLIDDADRSVAAPE